MSYYRIKDLPEESRPREKLLEKGPEALSEAELLAIALRTGQRGKSALDLAYDLLREAGSLAELATWSAEKLASFPGVGRAKAAQVLACLTLARKLGGRPGERLKIKNPGQAAEFIRSRFSLGKREVFGAIFLNQASFVIRAEIIHTGGRKSSTVDVGFLMKRALEVGATRLIVFHNHPSGNPEPSPEDRKLTHKIEEAARLLDMELLDHIIIGGDKFFSFETGG